MSPSIYLGCQVEDEIDTAYTAVRSTFSDYKKQTDKLLADLAEEIEGLSSAKTAAKVTVGDTTNNQIRWVAKQPGIEGNSIKITYQYLGPGPVTGYVFASRPPSARLEGDTIYVTLAVRGGDATIPPDPLIGSIDPSFDTATCLPIWLSGSGVSDLVSAELVGTGTDLPVVSPVQNFSGGKGSPLKDAEDAATEIARVFGATTYTGFMRSLDIPTIETEADAVALLEQLDQEYVIINRKLFIVDGTNLVGLRQLYNSVGQDLAKFKQLLVAMTAEKRFAYYVATENVYAVRQELVCGVIQEVSTFSERYIDINFPISKMVDKSQSKNLSSINNYIYWVGDVSSTLYSCTKLEAWGWSGDYLSSILAGESPQQGDFNQIQAPTVTVVEDPELFLKLGFTDVEILELLEKDIEGIRIPNKNDPDDKSSGLQKIISNNRRYMPNGTMSTAKKPLVAMQAIDASATGNDENLSKELAARGKTCARLAKNLPDVQLPSLGGIKVPSPDLPDMPSADLPSASKKIESSFAALSSMVNSASKLFDSQIDGIIKVAKGMLNKIQNLLSLADNLFQNSIAKCLLGTGEATTGGLDVPTPGGGTTPSVGGLPLPTSLLTAALSSLSVSLDQTITTSFESIMKLVSYPLCMIQSLMSSLQGFSLDVDLNSLNPCKEGKDPDENCPPGDVQDSANSSESVTAALDALPQTELYDSQDTITEVEESIQAFTGQVEKSVVSTTNEVRRGISDVMGEITKSLNAKVAFVREIERSIKELISDTKDSADKGEEQEKEGSGCLTTSLGALTDAITSYI